MSERMEHIGERETLRHIHKRLAAEVTSHRDSIRATLPITGDVEKIEDEYLLSLVLALNEKLRELRGIDYKIAILNEKLGD